MPWFCCFGVTSVEPLFFCFVLWLLLFCFCFVFFFSWRELLVSYFIWDYIFCRAVLVRCPNTKYDFFLFSCLFCHTGETDAEEGNLSPGFSMEKLETHSEVLFTRKRADSLSLYTIDTAELEGLLTRPDEEVVDRMIDEETSKSGRVRLIALLPF